MYVPLSGCSPTPLLDYLKALGVLRVISEQQPELDLRGGWRDEHFVLFGEIDEAALEEFFLENYAPSAIVAPWNGGSGFHPNDNKKAITEIAEGKADRFGLFREVISASKAALENLNLTEKPEGKIKEELLRLCRNTFPDAALGWLDAAFVLTRDGVRYPPLLGTGGNEGRLDLTNNYMGRLTELFDPETGEGRSGSRDLLRNALFGHTVTGLMDKAIGQFGPAAAGGANTSSGFSTGSLVNPWDFILMLEGSMLFASATVKRLGSSHGGALAYPFSVRTTGVGYGSASGADEADSRAEMWMPLWETPASFSEVRSLLNEGRVQIGLRPAKDGLDFYRAVTALGVDRGIDAFQRYGFLVRNGLAYFATPMDRVAVQRNMAASGLLAELDTNRWLDLFRQKALGKNAPGAVARACRQLERAIIALCTSSQELSPVRVRLLLVALGRCESAMANSIDWTRENNLRPVPLLSPKWVSSGASIDDSTSVEYRLAAALASLTLTGYFGGTSYPLRCHLEPVEILGRRGSRWVSWSKENSRDVIGLSGHLVERMNDIIRRRIILCAETCQSGWQEFSALTAYLSDVAAFIEGNCDYDLLAELVAGFSLLDWSDPGISQAALPRPSYDFEPDAYFALLKLCHAGARKDQEKSIPLDSSIHRFAATGNSDRAAELAIRRLRSSGVRVGFHELKGGGQNKRTAAALLFPLWSDQREALEKIIHAERGEMDSEGDLTHETINKL